MLTLATGLDRLWKDCVGSTGAPDLQRWWSSVRSASDPPELQDILAALLLDQQYRWKTPDFWLVENYIERLSLPDGIDWLLELAVGEFTSRVHAGRSVGVDEMLSRFPDLGGNLRERLSVEASQSTTVREATIHVRVAPEILDKRYRIDGKLGVGTFGCVSRAWDLRLERVVAIKRPAEGFAFDRTKAEEYLNEARKLAEISHPHIPDVYEFVENSESGAYLVIEYIDGKTLQDLLREKHPPHAMLKLLIPIAEALAFMHGKGVVHRDVKPANILVRSSDARPYLVDFGLAIRPEEQVHGRKLAGTPAYMSPEQVRAERKIDGRSDIFSLGVILYEMLTGKLPSRGPGLQMSEEISAAGLFGLPGISQSSIPSELASICQRALARRVEDRYCDAKDFARALMSGLDQQRGTGTEEYGDHQQSSSSSVAGRSTVIAGASVIDDTHPGRMKLRQQSERHLQDRQLRTLLLSANNLSANLTAQELNEAIFSITPQLRPRPAKRTPMCFLFSAAEHLRRQNDVIDPVLVRALKSLAATLLPISVVDEHPDGIGRRTRISGTTQRIATDNPQIGAAIVAVNMGLRVWLENDESMIVEDAVFGSDGRERIRERTRGGIPIDGLHAGDLLECLCEYLSRIPELQSPTDRLEDVWAALDIWEGRGAFVTVMLMDRLPEESLAAVQEALPPLILVQADGSTNSGVNSLVLQQLSAIDRLILTHRGGRS